LQGFALAGTADFIGFQSDRDWELMWAPYDLPTYRMVLEEISAEDVVLEIGAGDLRLSRLLAKISCRVYAIEIQTEILENQTQPLPANLNVIIGDALTIPYPKHVSVGVLLMRHCTHFEIYANRLKKMGVQRLVTNARWRFGVEVINLQSKRIPYRLAEMGWYACWCGAAGFKTGEVDKYTIEMDTRINEVIGCPRCYSPMTKKERKEILYAA
jgi:hypothetical protein